MKKERAGSYRKNLTGDLSYRSFNPSPLPPNPSVVIDKEMTDLLLDASSNIAKLNTSVQFIPNIKLFISMYVRKEALMSSQIEGTQATLEDVFNPIIKTNKLQDIDEVVNYVKAIDYASDRLKELPICNRLIKETHAILMNNTRGQDKSPGEFRHSQNWLGGKGSTLKNARYIPPCIDDMIKCMGDLENYINSEDDLNPLIQAALIHYQFETIHPFLDGNGRIGRLLITLFLMQRGVIESPVLYVSYYLKQNKVEYYDRLNKVRSDGDYEQWVRFFLEAVKESSLDAISVIERLHELNIKNTKVIESMTKRSKYDTKVFSYIESNPIVDIKSVSKSLGLSFNTVSSIINKFIEEGILVKAESKDRNRTFIYEEYLNILRKGTEL